MIIENLIPGDLFYTNPRGIWWFNGTKPFLSEDSLFDAYTGRNVSYKLLTKKEIVILLKVVDIKQIKKIQTSRLMGQIKDYTTYVYIILYKLKIGYIFEHIGKTVLLDIKNG